MSAPVPARAGDRVLWPDLAKGLCILLVVLHHTTTKHYLGLVPTQVDWVAGAWVETSHFLKPVRMPLFFVISGLFAASALDRPWRQVARRAGAPYYLYVVWLLVLGAVFAVERTLPMNRTQDLGELAVDLVFASTGLWFLYALAAYFVLAKLVRQLPVAWVLIPAAVVTASASALPFDEVNRVAVLVHFTYFLLGSRCPDLVWALARGSHGRLLPALALAYVALEAIMQATSAPAGVRLLVLSMLGIPMALVASVALSRRPQVARPLAWVGRRTLPIYVLHVPLLAVLHHSPVEFSTMTGAPAVALALAYPLLSTVGVVVGCLAVHRALLGTGFGALFALPEHHGRHEAGHTEALRVSGVADDELSPSAVPPATS